MASPSGPAKAYIVLVQPPKDNAIPKLSKVKSDAKGKGLGRIEFMFNPKDYSVTKKANWKHRDNKGAASVPQADFLGSQPAEITLATTIDHSDKSTPTITKIADMLLSAVVPIPSTIKAKAPTPPWAIFGWGTRIPMLAVINSVTIKYTMFRPSGEPIRAECSISLLEIPTTPTLKQNPTSGGVDVLRQHTVIAGDTLPSIAMEAFGDPARWRQLADRNRIDDPFSIREGDTILLPDPNDTTLGDEQ